MLNEQAESLKKHSFKNKKAVELVYKKMFQYFKDKEIVKYHEKRKYGSNSSNIYREI